MRRGGAEGAHIRQQQDARRRPYPLVDNNRKWFYIVVIFRVSLIAWVLTWTDIFAEPPDESEGRSALPGVRWFGDTLRSIGWKTGLWKTVTAGSTVELGGQGTAATQKPLGVDELLFPIEGRCFSYRREPQPRHEHGPLTFQWCHGLRATLYRSKGKSSDARQMPKERDLGKLLENDFGSPPGFPTVSYFFGDGDLCAASGDSDTGIESFQAGGRGADDPDESQRFSVTVRVWYCSRKDSGRDSRSEKTVIVNVREWSAEGDGLAGEEGSGEQGSDGRRRRVEGCHYVADVCTTLLKPLYKRDCPGSAGSGDQCWHAEPSEGSYVPVPPPTIVPRALRGFLDYDRWKPMDNETRLGLLEDVRGMFVHAYDGYMAHAFPAGELRPLSCLPGALELVKLPLVTLVDTLDTLAIMGNASEFRRAVRLVSERLDVSLDVDVSLFETNIRLLGGLLSAHLLATDPALGLYPDPALSRGDANDGAGSSEQVVANAVEDSGAAGLGRRDSGGDGDGYGGELLALAEDLGRRLLPAFETETGIPYGTVNLKTGVPEGETAESSLAGAGSLSLEFSVLSALTNDERFAKAAEGAVKALFARRSSTLGLVGKHIDSRRGRWTEAESGVGPNGDSFYEYLLKMYVLWGDLKYWDMFMQSYASVQRFLREGDWYTSAEMSTGIQSRNTFENLMAFWPGMQVLMGDVEQASRTLNAFYLVWRDWGFLPEQLDYQTWALKTSKDSRGYPLRPELIESTLMMYRATGDSSWLWAGRDFMSSIQAFCKTSCGYAGVGDIHSTELDDQMPSFFLSETLKYLYLLFDEDNFIHKSEYVFSTEAHPFPISRVRQGGKGASPGSTPRAANAEKVSAGTAPSSSSSSSSSCPSRASGLFSPTVTSSPSRSTSPSPTNPVCSTISPTLVTSSATAADGIDLAAIDATTGTTTAPTVTAASTTFAPEDGVEGGCGDVESDAEEMRSDGGKLSDACHAGGSTEESDERSPLKGDHAARTDQSGGDSRLAGQPHEEEPQPEQQQHAKPDGGSPTFSTGVSGATQGFSTGEGTILATWEAGSWAARRVAEGRSHLLGHDRWSDANTLCWIKAAERLEKNERAISREQYEELLYMRSLWQMYIDRTCPVLPWWSAPYRYDPLNFRDRIEGSGRDVWKSLISVADTLGCNSSIYRSGEEGITDPSRLGSLFKNVHSQIIFREDLGTFEVSSKDGNFLVFHRETREVIEVLQCSGQTAGEGPGLHISSYFRPLPVPPSSPSYRAPQTRSQDERPEAPADGGHEETGAGGAEGKIDLGGQAEGIGGENVPEEPLPEEGSGEMGDEDDGKAEELDGRTEGDMVGDMGGDIEGDIEGDMVGDMKPGLEEDMGGDMGREMERDVEGEVNSTSGVGDASRGKEVDKRLDEATIPESAAAPEARDVRMASLGFSPSILRLRTIITRKEGLSVYCVVYLVGREKEHGCALATFSPQSHKTPVEPIVAEVVAATSSDMFGCASGSDEGDGGGSSAGGGDVVGRRSPNDDGGDASGARPYSGKIRIVRRGFCPFEEKARVAEGMGAVALIVVNSEAGGRVFPMTGESEHLDEASDVSIPVVMVGVADGIEIQEAAAARANGVDGGNSAAAKAVLEISMHHQVAVERLLQSEDYVFPGEGREVADAIRLSALHLAWHGTLPLFPRRTRTEWWQSWWPWPRRRSPGETEAGTGTETGTVQMAQGGKDGDGVLVDGYLESLEKLQWLDQSGGTADGVSGAGDKGVHSVEDELRHPLLAGYTRSTVEGMRPPPFLLPRAFTLDNEVQVMGLGHWGVSVSLLGNGRLSLYLVYNEFNPPRRRDEAEDEELQKTREVQEAPDDYDDGADDVLDKATCSDDPEP